MTVATITLSNKGQVLIPKEIRDELHWEAGHELTIETIESGVLLKSRPMEKMLRAENVRVYPKHEGSPTPTGELCQPVEYGNQSPLTEFSAPRASPGPDVRPFVIDRVRCGERTLQARTALVIAPILDDDGHYICLNYEALGIDVYARTRESLAEELSEQLAMLWEEYALESDERLEPSARSLKSALLAAFEVAADAA